MRMNKVILIVGGRGTGKTSFANNPGKDPNVTRPGLVQEWIKARKGRPDERVLIVDTLDHEKYRDYQVITPQMIPVWNKGVKRVICNETGFWDLFKVIHNNLYNCLIIFEDASKYIRNTKPLPDDLNNFIVDSKQKNLDLIFMYHSFGQSHIDMWRMADILVLFKTGDQPKGDKGGTNPTVIQAYNEVIKDASRFAFKINYLQ